MREQVDQIVWKTVRPHRRFVDRRDGIVPWLYGKTDEVLVALLQENLYA